MLKRAPAPVVTPFQVVAFDVETTGAEISTARIVSFSVALVNQDADGRVAVNTLVDGLINPGVPIEREAFAVHGVTDELAATVGAEPRVALGQIADALRHATGVFGVPVCAFNARFDLSVLACELQRHGLDAAWLMGAPVVDPMVLDRQFDPRRPSSRRLPLVCRHYGVPLVDAHDPGADAVAAAGVFFKLLNKFEKLRVLASSVPELHFAQVEWAAAQAAGLQQHLREKGDDPAVFIDPDWPIAGVGVVS